MSHRGLLLLWLGLTGCYLFLGLSYHQYSHTRQVTSALQTWMPAHLQGALKHAYLNDDPNRQFIQRTNRDLQHQLSHYECQLTLVSLSHDSQSNSGNDQSDLVEIIWSANGLHYRAGFNLNCQTDWWRHSLFAASLALLSCAIIALVPGPISPQRALWLKTCLEAKCSLGTALELTRNIEPLTDCARYRLEMLIQDWGFNVQTVLQADFKEPIRLLSQDQEAWFFLALNQTLKTTEPSQAALHYALQIATAKPALQFKPEAGRLWVHGLEIALSKTPYFYYLWYAIRRFDPAQQGWLVNPSVQKPNKRDAIDLVALMEKFGGHRKAINDLELHGLRAKSLDQNRNKIKEEMISALGDTLARPFLFETERDLQTGRMRYRLACSDIQIDENR